MAVCGRKSQNSSRTEAKAVIEGRPHEGPVFLAWFSKGCNPSTQVRFIWGIDYAFSWSEGGELVPGVTFDASQTVPADPSRADANAIGLTHNKVGYTFLPSTKSVPVGSLGVFADNTVPVKKASVGIAMGGASAVAVQAGPNLNFTFKPHPKYWVCFGDYLEGEVIDINEMTNVQEIIFGPNEYALHVTLKADNTWKVENAASYNAMLLKKFGK